ncbi:g8193 [Coccomyxa viridis]|uniref:G8193 protein n=1 Tax=Coccomyxa viridis TaxID=1274662 RepID=A0ABP1G0W3_9CHLO
MSRYAHDAADMDITVTGTDAKGRELTFKHPAVQSAMMFFGELLCLVPFFISYWRSTAGSGGAGKRSPSGFRSETPAHKLRTLLTFGLPAFCDAGATTMLNIGLFYTYASVFQMLRGTMVVFAGLLTIVILRRALHLHHWMGIILILAGAALVGASSVMYDGGAVEGQHGHPRSLLWAEGSMVGENLGSAGSAAKPLLGDILVVLAQLLAATQFIVEEKYLAKYRVPALLAVGLEGFWGLVISAVALPILGVVRGTDGLPLDSTTQAFREIAGSTQLQLTTIGSILSIAFFNFFGISVTKNLSGAARCTIDACRTLFVWMFSLYAGWETFHGLEVVGFVVLVSGTSLYNELIRSCLPAVYESTVDSDLEDALLAAAPEDSGLAAVSQESGDGVRPSPGRNIRTMAKPRSISGSLYTMARSMRLFPTALSPHSLASPATHGLGEARIHPSSSSMLSATPDNATGYIPVDDLPNAASAHMEDEEESLPMGQQDEEKQQPRSRSARS